MTIPMAFKPGQREPIGQIVRHRTDKVIACLFPTVALFLRLIPADVRAGEVVFQVIVEEVHDPLMQRRLVALHWRHIIPFAIEDFLGDLGLATHRVDGDQRPGNSRISSSFGMAVISLLLASTTTWPRLI